MIKQRQKVAPFDVREGRVMVSLGPLSSQKYCTYSCPFCYVHTDFLSYASMSVAEIINWLTSLEEPFDIIYVSGDTDSFAKPRTSLGLQLLMELTQFHVDILFTTRAVFTRSELGQLTNVQEKMIANRKLLFGCVSVAQLTFPHLEPPPIQPPSDRIDQLRQFKKIGLISVLAMRPFLPIVPVSEYLHIVDLTSDFIDVILGEVWYADKTRILEQGVFRGPTPQDVPFAEHKMDFDINDATWKVFEAKEIELSVRSYCEDKKIPFFMRSRSAIDLIRKQQRY